MTEHRARGKLAVEDMRARIEAGWNVEMLWARMAAAEQLGNGYVYDYARLERPALEVSVED